jgi:hypothetical protein
MQCKSACRSLLAMLVIVALFEQAQSARYLDIDIQVHNYWHRSIYVNGSLSWGHWYRDDDKSESVGDPDLTIRKGLSVSIKACGALLTMSGTEGSLTAYDTYTYKTIGRFEFKIPYFHDNDVRIGFGETPGTAASITKWDVDGGIGKISWYLFHH